MQRLLKNRRNKAKSEKEIKVQAELKDLQDEKEEQLVDLKRKKVQIEGLLEQDRSQPKPLSQKHAESAASLGRSPGGDTSMETDQNPKLDELKERAAKRAADLGRK